MKKHRLLPLFVILAVAAVMLLIPLLALVPKPQSTPYDTETDIADIAKADKVRLYRSGDTNPQILTQADYLTGVVACEMSAQSDKQALMAQSVAARTLFYRTIQNGGKITDDTNSFQGYIDDNERRKKWGNNFDTYEKKVREAVNATDGEIITFDGKPILAVYHALSAGRTESAKNVWGEDYPYLQPVESVGDMMADGYLTETKVSKADYIAAAKKLGATAPDLPKVDTSPKMSDSGTVLEYNLCGKTVTGAQMRSAFKLRSAAFEVSADGDGFVFKTRGYGHGVGMSQFGANYMARQGSGYKEILLWYYKGCKVTNVSK